MRASDKLAEKVRLYLGDSVEDAVMTFAEDGSTWRELVDLAREVQESEQLNLPTSVPRICKHGYRDGAFGGCEECETPNRIDF